MANKAAFGKLTACPMCLAYVIKVKSVHEPPQAVIIDQRGWRSGGKTQGIYVDADTIYMSKRHTIHDCESDRKKSFRAVRRQVARAIQARKQMRMFPEMMKPRKPPSKRKGDSAAFRKKADEMMGKR